MITIEKWRSELELERLILQRRSRLFNAEALRMPVAWPSSTGLARSLHYLRYVESGIGSGNATSFTIIVSGVHYRGDSSAKSNSSDASKAILIMEKPTLRRDDSVIVRTVLPHSLPAHLIHRDIARRAYALYEARGREHGHDVDDWLQAERELHNALRSRDRISAAGP